MLRLFTALAAVVALSIAPNAIAQPAQARAGAATDLTARFAEAKADPQLGDKLLTIGRKVAAVCANCHGAGGNSSKPTVPNLAGQNPVYLLEQVRQFADGRRRDMWM